MHQDHRAALKDTRSGAVLEGLLNLFHARQDGQVDVLLAHINYDPSYDGWLHLCTTRLVSM